MAYQNNNRITGYRNVDLSETVLKINDIKQLSNDLKLYRHRDAMLFILTNTTDTIPENEANAEKSIAQEMSMHQDGIREHVDKADIYTPSNLLRYIYRSAIFKDCIQHLDSKIKEQKDHAALSEDELDQRINTFRTKYVSNLPIPFSLLPLLGIVLEKIDDIDAGEILDNAEHNEKSTVVNARQTYFDEAARSIKKLFQEHQTFIAKDTNAEAIISASIRHDFDFNIEKPEQHFTKALLVNQIISQIEETENSEDFSYRVTKEHNRYSFERKRLIAIEDETIFAHFRTLNPQASRYDYQLYNESAGVYVTSFISKAPVDSLGGWNNLMQGLKNECDKLLPLMPKLPGKEPKTFATHNPKFHH